jgi:hypothetical protein
MLEIVANPPLLRCYPLFSRSGIQQSQQLAPDPFLPRAGASPREAPATRAAGRAAFPIPSGACRILRPRPQSAQALPDLIDRKPDLLRSLAAQLLPRPLASIDPAERLGIDFTSLRTVADFRQVLTTVLAAISRGEIAPGRERAHRAAGRGPTKRRPAPRMIEHRVAHETGPGQMPLV